MSPDFILEDREDELIEAIAEASETDPTITVCSPKISNPNSSTALNTTANPGRTCRRVGKSQSRSKTG